MLTSEAYNEFALSFVDHIVERAQGQDSASARIVNARPSDHVLTGFLTPVKPPKQSDGGELDEEELCEDLPQDSAYEQSAVGLEWLVPKSALAIGRLSLLANLSVYIRRLPTYEEQQKEFSWSKGRGLDDTQTSPVIPVWTREDLPVLQGEVDLAHLLGKNKYLLPLKSQVIGYWQEHIHSIRDLYPAAQKIEIAAADFTPQGYPAWLSKQRPTAAVLKAYNWAPRIDLRLVTVPTEPDCVRLSLRLINSTPWRNTIQQEFFDPNFYAVRLTVTVPKDAHRLVELTDLPRSYRYDRTIPAVGINADVSIQSETPQSYVFITQSVPRKQINRLEPREILGAEPTFKALANDPVPLLDCILTAMKDYDRQAWQRKIDSLSQSQLADATYDRELFRTDEIAAFERGIAVLRHQEYPLIKRAFCLMNEVMERVAAGAYDRWRLFQIVFIVIQIPRMAIRHYPELEQASDDNVDILWFAAGGGKTEGFLGLLVWQMFFDRLRGKKVGTTALIRFPLRLLAFQQLQRVARVLAQAELIRKREQLRGARFSLGYFVGDNTRPNSINPDQHARYSANSPDESLRSLMRCPFCQAKVNLEYKKHLKLIEHYCSERTTCPGGPRPLPIYIVDTDIYRYLPTVIVSTVDKLALIGHNHRFGNLFGRFDIYCAEHGASFLDTNNDCEAACLYAKQTSSSGNSPQKCGEHQVLYGPFVDPTPALLIQDELHLLSEETGVFDSHYETAALEIIRSLGYRPWKIIAATATIERFDQHAHHLYLQHARQFPCPGPEAYDSFYYCVDPKRIGRIFVGVLGVGRKHTPSVTRLLSLIYQELQVARDKAAQDVTEACQYYRLPDLLTPQEFGNLIFYYELVLTYVLTRKGSDQIAEAIQSRVKKELRELMPQHGELHVETLNGGVDVTEMIETMEKIELAPTDVEPTERIRGVVATNIISHGVDINRFNIIVFGGFTRLVAEYIQASARVGRMFPGISFFVATPQSERDRSIFQRFGKIHEYIDRLVDPSAINRWPTQALERSVPGILAGYVMIVAAARLRKRLETVRRVLAALGQPDMTALNEAHILEWMKAALGTHQAPYARYAEELCRIASNRYSQIINAAPDQIQGWDGIPRILEPMRSLRDIDDPAFIDMTMHDSPILRAMLRP